MQLTFGGSQSFNAGYFGTIRLSRQRQAAQHPLAINQYRAGTALPLIAPFFGAGQVKMLTQCIEQGDTGIDLHLLRLTINLHC